MQERSVTSARHAGLIEWSSLFSHQVQPRPGSPHVGFLLKSNDPRGLVRTVRLLRNINPNEENLDVLWASGNASDHATGIFDRDKVLHAVQARISGIHQDRNLVTGNSEVLGRLDLEEEALKEFAGDVEHGLSGPEMLMVAPVHELSSGLLGGNDPRMKFAGDALNRALSNPNIGDAEFEAALEAHQRVLEGLLQEGQRDLSYDPYQNIRAALLPVPAGSDRPFHLFYAVR